MKFIKTSDGYLVNPAQVKYFQVCDDGSIRVVFGIAYTGAGLNMRAISDEVVIYAGNNRTEAEKFLNKFLAQDEDFYSDF